MAASAETTYRVDGLHINLNDLQDISTHLEAPIIKRGRLVIDVVDAFTRHRELCDRLRDRLLRLLPVVVLLIDRSGGKNDSAAFPSLRDNLRRLDSDLEIILEEVKKAQPIVRRKRHRVAALLGGPDCTVMLQKCNDDLDWAMEEFKVSSHFPAAIDAVQVAQNVKAILTNPFLRSLPRAKYAGFDSERPDSLSRCLEGTRTQLLKTITEWAVNPDPDISRFFWLDGMAGVGKTSVARTVAEIVRGMGFLGGEFAFSRRGEAELRNPALVFPTIAYQLARFDSDFGQRITAALEADFQAPYLSLKQQLDRLIIRPLSGLERDPGRIVLLIFDAFDECEARAAKEILQLLLATITYLPTYFKVFVTARPEAHIRAALTPSSNLRRTALHDIDASIVRADIHLFIRTRLRHLPEELDLDLPPEWVTDAEIALLAEKADTLFVCATSFVRFIMESFDLRRRLDALLRNVMTIGEVSDGINPLVDLDAMYLGILHDMVSPTNTARTTKAHQVLLGTIVRLREPLAVDELERLIGPDGPNATKILSLLHSIIHSPVPRDQYPCIYHPSFRDFLLNATRCTDDRFYIDPQTHDARLALRCLELLNANMREGVVGPDPMRLNSVEARGAVSTDLSVEFRYATQHWASHVVAAGQGGGLMVKAVEVFATRTMLHWIEIMSYLDDLSSCLKSLENVSLWAAKFLVGSPTASILNDGYRLLLAHFSTVKLGVHHIAQSIIPFLPRNIQLTSQYKHYTNAGIVMRQGMQLEWPVYLMAWTAHHNHITAVIYSPAGSELASASSDHSIRIWDAATGGNLTTLQGHCGPVNSITYSSENSRLASGSDDRTVHLWERTTGQKVTTLTGHTGKVSSVAYSPDATQLASGSDDKTIRLWAVAHGRWLATLDAHSRSVGSVAYSPDGTRLASAAEDGTGRVWDIATLAALTVLKGHSGNVTCIVFSPDNLHVSSGSTDNTVRTWDANSGTEVTRFNGHTLPVNSIAYSSNGLLLASGSDDMTARVWDTTSGSCLSTLRGHSGPLTSVTISPSNLHLASASHDKTVRLWDLTTGIHLATLEGHSERVRAVAFSFDGSELASVSDDCNVLRWNSRVDTTAKEVTKIPPRATLKGHSKPVTSIAYSPDGIQLASGSEDLTVRLWDAATGSCLVAIKGHEQHVTSVAFSPDGLRLTSGSGDSTIRIWDNTVHVCITTLEGHSDRVNSVAYSPDGTQLASGSDDETVFLWDTATGKSLTTLAGHSGRVRALAYSHALGGARLASGSDDETVRLWDVVTGVWLTTLQGHSSGVTSVAYSSDDLQLASGSEDTTVRVWDTTTGSCLSILEGHSTHVTSVAFSPYASRLASASSDRTLRVWDTSTSTSNTSIRRRGHSQRVTTIVFSLDGLRVASGAADKTVQVWDARTGDHLTTLQGHSDTITTLAFCSGYLLASGSDDKIVRMWDTAKGVCIVPLKGHSKAIRSIASTPDGSKLASASKDTLIRVWSTSSCKCLLTLRGHHHSVNSVLFCPDGVRLVSGSDDGTVRVWDTQKGACLGSRDGSGPIVSVSLNGLCCTSQDSGGKTSAWTLTASGLTEFTDEHQEEEVQGSGCWYELKDGRLDRLDTSGSTSLVCVIPVFYDVEVSCSYVPESGDAHVAFGCQNGEVVILDVVN